MSNTGQITKMASVIICTICQHYTKFGASSFLGEFHKKVKQFLFLFFYSIEYRFFICSISDLYAHLFIELSIYAFKILKWQKEEKKNFNNNNNNNKKKNICNE